MKMGSLSLLGLLWAVNLASAGTHSYHYFYTATAGIPGFPEFVVVGMVDGEQISYYDSISKKVIPRQEWVKGAVDADFWRRNAQILLGSQQSFKANIEIVKQRFNQTGGVHTLQQMVGCEWDSENGTTDGFWQYGYDGEDFISFDMKNMRWNAPSPQGGITKNKWDSNRDENEQKKSYLTQICIDWVKKYVGYGRSTLERKVPPEVSLLQKDPSSPVTCHASGFFPSGIVMSWQKNGKDLHEDVELGETLPNEDGTFQKMSRLRVKPEDWKRDTYTCTVQHKGLKEDIVKKVYEEEIRTNQEKSPPVAIIIGVVVAVLLVAVIAIAGFMVWRKKGKPGFVPANTSDDRSDCSTDSLVKA
ncbi:major histocompatibility complex class I-related gene protein-like isoform X1 [Megalops cyprinoides]|uniref:major histocompatibility complex class I-related gene protein-like isoform X1 n=1 Tax=Megalops cyprinoides TaxID=118141 RepID=UPI0018653EDA|nr:major histocompatibility complex class I-related gene protein-like isoform X1 [Megalops cyprinoides]